MNPIVAALMQALQRGGSLASKGLNAVRPALEHRAAKPMLGVGAGGIVMPSLGGGSPQQPTPAPLIPGMPQVPPDYRMNSGLSGGPYSNGNTYAGPGGTPRSGQSQTLPGPNMAGQAPSMMPGGFPNNGMAGPFAQAPGPSSAPNMQSMPDPWANMRVGNPMNIQPHSQTAGEKTQAFLETMLANFAKHGAKPGHRG